MNNYFLLDGAMGTYYQSKYHDDCFSANLAHPERILNIHKEYLDAGAQAILTNTFDVSRLIEENPDSIQSLKAACHIAREAVASTDAIVIGDLGPAFENSTEIYRRQIDTFLECGIEYFLFETLSDLSGIQESLCYLKEKNPEATIALSFAVDSSGMSRQGHSVRELLEQALSLPEVSIVGLNCLSSAYHLAAVLPKLDPGDKKLLVKPNAGYPKVIGHQIVYDSSTEYFAMQCARMIQKNVFFFGGCCGTTPAHIAALKEALESIETEETEDTFTPGVLAQTPGFWHKKTEAGRKVIAVELDPPFNDDIQSFMSGIGKLKQAGADVVTIADNPIGRPRADSSLLACKIHRETGIEALPHLTCRDRNLNAIKGLLLGLSIEDVHQVLVITGDPLPAESRDEVKSVYNFNSRKLASYISRLNQDLFSSKMHIFGALDLNARNFAVQTPLAEEKIEAGMEGFLTQPILSKEALENLKAFRKDHDTLILAGIFPIVSYKNAIFMQNEVNGVSVCDEIIDLYKEKNRQEGEDLAYRISMEIAKEAAPYCDGFYLMTPFKRVDLMNRIIEGIQDL